MLCLRVVAAPAREDLKDSRFGVLFWHAVTAEGVIQRGHLPGMQSSAKHSDPHDGDYGMAITDSV